MIKSSLFSLFMLFALQISANNETLSIGILHLPNSLNPANIQTSRDHRVILELYEGLITLGKNGEVIPGLAASWDVRNRGKEYHFTLRNNLYWSDGQPLVAMDFVNTWHAAIKYNSNSKSALKVLENFNEVDSGDLPLTKIGVYAPNDKTLVIVLKSPMAFFEKQLLQLDFMPLPMHAINEEDVGKEWSTTKNIPTSGPYKVLTTKLSNLTLIKNTLYHSNQSVNFKKIHFTAYLEKEGRMINDLVQEKISIAEIGSNSRQLLWLQRNYPDRLKYVGLPILTYLSFNSSDDTMHDQNIRKALAIAIDKSTLARALTSNISKYEIAHSFAPPEMYYLKQQIPVQKYQWGNAKRRQEAMQLLKKSGYSKSNKLALSLHVDNREHRVKLGKLIQGMWQNIDVEVKLNILPTKQHYENMHGNLQQISLGGWGQDYDEPYNFLNILHSDFFGEKSIKSDKIDQFLDRVLFTVDNEEREELYQSIEQVNRDLILKLPLTFSRDANLVSPNLLGYEYNGSIAHPSRWLQWRAGTNSDK